MKKNNKNKYLSVCDLNYIKIHEECVPTGSLSCNACPWLVLDENGSNMCYKDTYEHCLKGDLDEYFANGGL